MITKHDEIDLELPGKEKCVYFCIISDQDSSLEFLSSLQISVRRVSGAFKELIAAELIWERRCGRGYPNQIYLALVDLRESVSDIPEISPAQDELRHAEIACHDELESPEPALSYPR